MLASILTRCPHLHGTLYDLPRLADGARALIAREGLADRCRVVGGDMFEAVPAGGDVYVLSHILHDWDDARSLQILQHCRRVLPPDGRLLIVDRVMPEIVRARRSRCRPSTSRT